MEATNDSEDTETEERDAVELLANPEKLFDSVLEESVESPIPEHEAADPLAMDNGDGNPSDLPATTGSSAEDGASLTDSTPNSAGGTVSYGPGPNDADGLQRLSSSAQQPAAAASMHSAAATVMPSVAHFRGQDAALHDAVNTTRPQAWQPSAEQLQAEGLMAMEWHGAQVYARPGEWIVSFASVQGSANEQMAQINAMLQQVQPRLTVSSTLGQDGLVEIHGPEDTSIADVQATLSRLPGFRYAEPNQRVWVSAVPNDPGLADASLWGMHNTGQNGGTADADIDAPEAWNIATGSRSVVVGIIDTGIDWTHPDLAANIWTNPGEVAGDSIDNDANGYIDDIHGYDFVNNDGNPMDDNGHGTHVAGTIGGVGNNSQGVVGVNWQVSMMGLKFLDADGGGYLDDAVRALNYVNLMRTTYGVNIVLTNNSWGGGGYSTALYDAIAASGAANILFVAAAGNSANNNDAYPDPGYPSSYNLNNIVAVAATDRNDQLASFSSYGATSVDLAAPGVAIYSTVPGNSYATFSGTSMATPHVSGALALLSSTNPALSASQLKDRLLNTTDFVSGLYGKAATAGRLNARQLVDPLFTPAPVDLHLQSVTLGDAAGNQDGFADAGETITLLPRVVNTGTNTATNATIELVNSTPGVTVLGPTIISIGSVGRLQAISANSAFQLVLSSGLADLSQINLQFIVRYDGGTPQTFSHVVGVVGQLMPQAEVKLNFTPGEMVADPVRNRVYLIDQTNRRLLAIDTAVGTVVGQATLAGSPDNPTIGSRPSGHLAVAPDGSRLYVALTAAQKIQVFDPASLTSVAVFDYSSIPLLNMPVSMVAGVNNQLYVAVTEDSPGSGGEFDTLKQIDGSTGAIVSEFSKGEWANELTFYYKNALLRSNLAGTRLYVTETGLSSTGIEYIFEYDIAGATPTLLNRYGYKMDFTNDFVVDEEYQRLYILSGNKAVQVVDMVTGTRSLWPQATTGRALALQRGSPIVYVAGGDWVSSAPVHRLLRADGTPVGQYQARNGNTGIRDHSLKITPNGRLMYLAALPSGFALGAIGLPSLDLYSYPVVTSISRTASEFTAASTVSYLVTLSRNVTGVDASDFSVWTSGLTGASVASVTAVSDNVYRVTVNTGSSSSARQLRLDLIDNDTIRDSGSILLGGTGAGNGSFTSGQMYTVDRQPIRVASVSRIPYGSIAGPMSLLRVQFTYGDNVNPASFTKSDIVSFTGPTGAVPVYDVRPYSSTEFDIIFQPQTAVGNYTLVLGPDIRDLAGNQIDQNLNAVAGEVPGDRYTATITLAAPKVVSTWLITPPYYGPPSQFRVDFDREMDATTFTTADIVSFTGPAGAIPVTSVSLEPGSAGRRFILSFAPQGIAGTYTLVLGPDIRDLAGNRMDQNGNNIPGEVPGDRFTTSFQIGAPRVVSSYVTGGAVRIMFYQEINPASFTWADIVSFTGPNGAVPVASVNPVAPLSAGDPINRNFDIVPAVPLTPGTYSLVLGPDIRDTFGNPLDQNYNNIPGESPGDRYSTSFTVSSSSPAVLGPRLLSAFVDNLHPFSSVRLSFSSPIEPGTLTPADISLTGPGGAVAASAVQLASSDYKTFDVIFPTQGPAGTYNLLVRPDIADRLGNLLDQNLNGIGGEATADRYSLNFVLQGPSTWYSSNPAQAGSLNSWTVDFQRAMDLATLTPSAVSLTGPGGTIPVTSIVPVAGSGNAQFVINFPTQSRTGNYSLVLGTAIRDTFGNALDMNRNGIPGEMPADQITQTFSILAPTVGGGIPQGTTDTVSAVKIGFNKEIDPATFTTADVIRLVGPYGPIPVTGVTPVAGTGNTQFLVSFPTQTAEGTYKLVLSPEIRDLFGTPNNPLPIPENRRYIFFRNEGVAPFATISQTGPNFTSASSVDFLVGFNEDVTGVDLSDFRVAMGTGLNGAAITGLTALSGRSYRVTVHTGTGSGPLYLVLDDNDSIRGATGIPLGGPGPYGSVSQSYYIDRTFPAVMNISGVGSQGTNAARVDFVVSFNKWMNEVDASDFRLTTTGVSGAAITGVTPVPGTGGAFYVSVSTGTGNGTLRLDLVDNGTITDLYGNPLGGPGPSNGSSIGATFTIDKQAPAVVSLARASANPSSAATVDYTVTFTKNVSGVDTTDFVIASPGLSGAGVLGVTGSGSVYTATVRTGTGNGTLRLDLVDNDSIRDGSGNRLGGPGTGNGSFTGGETYTINRSVAVVSSTLVGSSPTSASSVQFDVRFIAAVTGVDVSDFALTTTGLTGAAVTAVTALAGDLYRVTVGSGTGSGTLRLDVIDNDSIRDAGGNSLGGVGAGNGNFTTGPAFTIDRSPPTVVSSARSGSNPSGATQVHFVVTFSESVTGVDISDFALTVTGVTGASIASVTALSGSQYRVTANTGTGSGTLRLDLVDNDSIRDTLGNALGGAGAGNGNFIAGESFTIDKPPRVLSSVLQNPSTTNLASVSFLVTFDKTVTGVDSADFSLTTTGITGAAITGVTALSGSQYQVTVSTGTGNGILRLNVIDNDTIRDTSTNPLGGAGAGNGNFATGQTYTIDKTVPVVLSIVRASPNPSSAPSVSFTVTFSETVTGVDVSDFGLTTTGLSGAAVTSVVNLGGGRFSVAVNPGTGSGTLRLDVLDNDSIRDTAGNTLGGSGAGNGNFTTGESYTVNRLVAVSSITRDNPATTNLGSVSFTVAFNNNVTGVDATDFALTITGITGAAITAVTAVSGSVYRVTVNTGNGNGTIRLDVIDDDTIQDAAGNKLGGTGAGNFTTGPLYTIDKTAPAVLSSVRSGTNPTGAAQVNFIVTFGENVSGVDLADFALTTTGVTGASVASVTALSGSSYKVTVNTGSGNGTIRLNVGDNDSIRDTAGNALGGAGAGNGSFGAGEAFTIDRGLQPATLSAEADTWVQASSPTMNRGTDTWLGVAQGERESYLRFNLGSIAGNVTGAHLRMMPAITGGAIASTTFQLQLVADDSWSEGAVNWNNKPAGSTVLATWTSETAGVVRDIDITSIVQQQLATDPGKKLSLVIVSTTPNTGTNWVYYSSREDSPTANRPQLVINVSPA